MAISGMGGPAQAEGEDEVGDPEGGHLSLRGALVAERYEGQRGGAGRGQHRIIGALEKVAQSPGEARRVWRGEVELRRRVEDLARVEAMRPAGELSPGACKVVGGQ